MNSSSKLIIEKIVDILDTAASYNDKGYIWSGHDESRQKIFRLNLQHELMQTCSELGWEKIGSELEQAIKSGIAISDFRGEYVAIARKTLGVPHIGSNILKF